MEEKILDLDEIASIDAPGIEAAAKVQLEIANLRKGNEIEVAEAVLEQFNFASDIQLLTFVPELFVYPRIRPNEIEAIATLTLNVISRKNSKKFRNRLKKIILDLAFVPVSDMRLIGEVSGTMHTLRALFDVGLFELDEIAETLGRFANENPLSPEQLLYSVVFFVVPLAKAAHPLLDSLEPMFNKLKNHCRAAHLVELNALMLNREYNVLDELRVNWTPKNSLAYYIMMDEVDELGNAQATTQLDPMPFHPTPLCQSSITAAQFAAFCGALNCIATLKTKVKETPVQTSGMDVYQSSQEISQQRSLIMNFAVAGGFEDACDLVAEQGITGFHLNRTQIEFRRSLEVSENPSQLLVEAARVNNLNAIMRLIMAGIDPSGVGSVLPFFRMSLFLFQRNTSLL